MFYNDNKMKDLGRIREFGDKRRALALFNIDLGALITSVDYAA